MVTYIKENREILKKYIKWTCFVILLIIASMAILALGIEGLQNKTSVTQKIYDYNCTLCIFSIILHISYVFVNFVGEKKEIIKTRIKQFFKKEWPCLLLTIFMAWTAVGCLGAGIEASAEAKLKDIYPGYKAGMTAENTEKLKGYSSLTDIAEWSKTLRAENAADRSWNGCANLKDGYFSFLFYATIVVDVILLGQNSEKMKKWILRIMMLSMVLMAFLTFLNFNNSDFMNGIMPYKRAIFHNSNHYGYYLSIGVILCATMFIKEKNLYFKIIGLLGFIVTTYMAILNNTFGAYLGILVAIVGMLIYSIVGVFSSRNSLEDNKDTSNKANPVAQLLKIITIVLIFGSFSFSITEPNKEKPIVIVNFETTYKDIGIWLDAAKSNEENYVEVNNNDKIDSEKNNKTDNNDEKETISKSAIANTGSGSGQVWVGVFELVKQTPFFGWGLENLLNEFYNQLDINEGRTHNLVLQLMGTTGIVGMLLYMVAVIAIFIRCLKRIKNWNMLEYITIFCFISYMVSSLFGNSAFYTSPYFMIILGILITANWNEKTVEKQKVNEKKNK